MAKPRDARNDGGSPRLSRLAPSVTRVSQAFCSTDQEKRETARSLDILQVNDYLFSKTGVLLLAVNLCKLLSEDNLARNSNVTLSRKINIVREIDT